MDESRKQALRDAGVNVEEGLERFMNNEALWERFLSRFPADPNPAALSAALDKGDWAAALALRGPIEEGCARITQLL